MKNRMPFFEGVAIIVGTIIGAGIIGVPYVFAESGFLTATLVLIFIGLALLFVRLMLGEVIMRTEGVYQLTGYTKRYLGTFFQNLQAVILITSIFGTLLAYMVSQGDILSELLGGNPVFWTLVFYLSFSFLVIFGIDVVKRSELLMIVAIFFIMVIIAGYSAPQINVSFLFDLDLSGSNILLPFGVIMFACAGLVSVPAAWRVVKRAGREDLYKSVLIWGGVIPPVIYLIFALLVVGITGPETSQVATVSLGEVIGPHMVIIGNVFAFFTVATSFLTIALAQQDIFQQDYKLSRPLASSLVVTVPLVLFALGVRDFIGIISVVGALMVGVNGLLAVLLFWKAREHGEVEPYFAIPAWIAAPASIFLVVVFVAGLISIFV
ncbi:MAG: aromatic amino acid transport family protein [Candidatus Paceibacterota bacterium]